MESQPGRYEFLPHTADAKYKAWGSSVEELFANAAEACFAVITNVAAVEAKLSFPVEKKAKSVEALLFDFLDELLFLLDTEGFLLSQLDDLKILEQNDEFFLACTARGDHYKGYDVGCNVKAVTYNEMYVRGPKETGKIEGGPGAWECQVVVDL